MKRQCFQVHHPGPGRFQFRHELRQLAEKRALARARVPEQGVGRHRGLPVGQTAQHFLSIGLVTALDRHRVDAHQGKQESHIAAALSPAPAHDGQTAPFAQRAGQLYQLAEISRQPRADEFHRHDPSLGRTLVLVGKAHSRAGGIIEEREVEGAGDVSIGELGGGADVYQ